MDAFYGQALEIAVAGNSIVNPAESASPGMLAVGAARWNTPTTIESFSSRGPTTDGRTKPDIVGADGGAAVSYPGGFFGTSQASPHLAGLAALVLQRSPNFTPVQVADYLKSNASPRGAVPNNTWGYGFAELPPLEPGPPGDVTAAPGNGEATVSWSTPSADGGSPITLYTVTSSPPSLGATVSSTLSAVVTGLTNGTEYIFTVTASNAVGTSTPSSPSDPLTPSSPPDPPANVSAAAGDSQATVSWDPPSSDGGNPITHYTVTSSPPSLGATVASSTVSTTVAGLTDGTTYEFVVTATNVVGTSTPSTSSNFVIPTNQTPSVEMAAPVTLNEGSAFGGQFATVTDPGVDDTHTAAIDWGDGSSLESGIVDQGAGTVSGSHVYGDNGVYTLTVTVTDSGAGSGSGSVTSTVDNLPPVVEVGSGVTLDEGSTFDSQLATSTDPGIDDTHTATIDWGDGSPLEAGIVDQGAGTVSGSHTYADDGAYTVTVTVTDSDGGSGSNNITSTVNKPAAVGGCRPRPSGPRRGCL